MDCIVLAGGVPSPGDTLYPHTNGMPKAGLQVAGRAIGQRVIDALTEAATISRIVVVGDVEVASSKLEAMVPAPGGLVENFLAGVEVLGDGGMVAGCTSDIPLLTGAMVDWFIGAADGGDATAGIIRRESVERRYPEYPNAYWKLTDGEFTAADFIVFRPGRVPELAGRLRPLADARKNALQTARLIGPGLLFRLLLHRLSVAQAERYISKALDIEVRIIDVPHPEMGLDVDEDVHLAVLERALERHETERLE